MSRHLPFCWGRWSKWEKKRADFEKHRIVFGHWTTSDKPLEPIIITKSWQERVCQKCGKVQQEMLDL